MPMKKKKKALLKTKKKAKTMAKKTVKTKKRKVLAIPKGYNSITPYLIVKNGKKAIEFYVKAFGAKQVMCMEKPGGKIAHAELKIGDSKVMLGEECPEMHAYGPEKFGGSPMSIYLYVKNVDAIVERAVAVGGTLIKPVETMFYGDRSGAVKDPSGHIWYVATHVEDVSLAKIRKRAEEMYSQKS